MGVATALPIGHSPEGSPLGRTHLLEDLDQGSNELVDVDFPAAFGIDPDLARPDADDPALRFRLYGE
jgi:hypothetical protein